MNKLNWPTAFVIVAIIFAGAFVYNKPTTAAFGSNEMISSGEKNYAWHLKNGKVRICMHMGPSAVPLCTNWSKD